MDNLKDILNTVICGDCLTILKTLPSDSIDCCISSPPYYALRDYGVEGQLGLEKTFHEYLNKLIEIYAEVKRVLKPTGTVWVNLGDSYSGSGNGTNDYRTEKSKSLSGKRFDYNRLFQGKQERQGSCGVIAKSLLNIPSRFAIKMTDELNLIQRNEIIWYKRNCMPSSVKDRFTVDFEKIYFFTKSKKYYFEQITEETQTKGIRTNNKYTGDNPNFPNKSKNTNSGLKSFEIGITRNKRCVWDITTKPYKEAHFATFPEDLVRPMIQSGCPEFICDKCGKPRQKIYITDKEIIVPPFGGKKHTGRNGNDTYSGKTKQLIKKENGFIACDCNSTFSGGIVLDIFAGSGTTLKVAKEMGRNYIGIELNPEYMKLIEKRLNNIPLKLIG